MSSKDVKLSSAALTAAVGDRIRLWLKCRWPDDTAKQAARAFDASPRTVKEWLAGQPPSNKHFWAMVACWGWPFLRWVSSPIVSPEQEAELGQQLADLEAGLRALRRDLVEARGGVGMAVGAGSHAPGDLARRSGEARRAAVSGPDRTIGPLVDHAVRTGRRANSPNEAA